MEKQPVEKPILFKPEMIKALCANKKTVTRRLVKPQPPEYIDWFEYFKIDNTFRGYMEPGGIPTIDRIDAKYWPGLKLWVREIFTRMKFPENSLIMKSPDSDGWYKHGDSVYCYKASMEGYPDDRWSSPLFLPRIASRFLLKITDVKIERLHELDDIDAVLEGCKNRDDYARLWNEIYSETGYTWEKCPFVYRIQFEKLEAGNGGN